MSEMKMLEHQKIILENVRQDKKLFQKELVKSVNWLEDEEQKQLYHWLRKFFWKTHKKVIESVFKIEAA
jgi:ribosome recycling factor